MAATVLQEFSGVDSAGIEYAFDLVYDNGGTADAVDDELKIVMKAGSMNLNAIYLSDGDAQAWEIEGSDPFAKVVRKLPIQDGKEKAPKLVGRIKFDQPLKADRLSPALNMNGSGVSWDSLLVTSDPGLAGAQPLQAGDELVLSGLREDLASLRELDTARVDKKLIFGFRATSVNAGDSIKLVSEVASTLKELTAFLGRLDAAAAFSLVDTTAAMV
jgi:hypothetical protein